jgi:subtilisin family serine protease
MNSVLSGFDIVGVAPEATLYAYKALDCEGHGGSDNMIAAMLQAQIDGVDIVSMSIGLGAQSFSGEIDPVAAVTKK